MAQGAEHLLSKHETLRKKKKNDRQRGWEE
jgi:hypothetical protein